MKCEASPTKSSRRRPPAWKVLAGLLGVGLLNLAFLAWGENRLVAWLSWAIAGAPNYGRTEATVGSADSFPGNRTEPSRLFRIATEPGVTISVLVLDPPGDNAPGGTVFVVHGIRDRKESQLGQGRYLAALGYRVVLPDLRGHGESGGSWLSYGVLDRRDLAKVLDQLSEAGLVAGRVGAVGHSYGAATIIQWAGEDPRVQALVAVAPFADLRSVVPDYIRLYLDGLSGVIPDKTVSRGIEAAGRLGGFDPAEASPLRQIPRVRGAVLLIHGGADRHIPVAHSFRLRQAAPPGSRLVIIREAGHYTINSRFGQTVRRETRDWLRAHLVTSPTTVKTQEGRRIE